MGSNQFYVSEILFLFFIWTALVNNQDKEMKDVIDVSTLTVRFDTLKT